MPGRFSGYIETNLAYKVVTDVMTDFGGQQDREVAYGAAEPTPCSRCSHMKVTSLCATPV